MKAAFTTISNDNTMKKRLYFLVILTLVLPLLAFGSGDTEGQNSAKADTETVSKTQLYTFTGVAILLGVVGIAAGLSARKGRNDADSDKIQNAVRALAREEIDKKLRSNAAKDNAIGTQDELARLTLRVETLERAIASMCQRPPKPTEQPLRKIRTEGYFGIFKGSNPPFFNDFHTTLRGESIFSVTAEGDVCEFWPIDINRLKGRDVRAVVDFQGAKLENSTDFNVESSGRAHKDVHGYWVVDKKVAVKLI